MAKFQHPKEEGSIIIRRGDTLIFWCGNTFFPCSQCRCDTQWAIMGIDKIFFGIAICSDECLKLREEA